MTLMNFRELIMVERTHEGNYKLMGAIQTIIDVGIQIEILVIR